jgi:cobalt-zinc-cadmium efflux system outer membrane protein
MKLQSKHNNHASIPVANVIIVLMQFSLSSAQSDTSDLNSNNLIYKNMLDSILNQAVSQNPNLQASKLKAESSRASVNTIGISPPQAAVEFFQAPVTSFPNPLKDQMEVDYSLQQEIPFPGKVGKMRLAEKNRTNMAESDAQTTKQELIRSVKATFNELYLIDRQIDINSRNQKLTRSFEEIALKQYELGMGRQTDILRAQTEISRLMSDSIRLTQSRQSTVAMLNAYRNMYVESPIATIPEIAPEKIVLPPLDSLISIADENRPELKAMQYNIAMQSAELASAKKEFYPDFMVRGTYKQMRNQTDDWALMLGLNLPVAPWASGRYSAAVIRSNGLVNQSQAEYKNMKNMIASQVKDALAKVTSSQAQIDLLKTTTIPQAQQTVQSAIAGYQTGKLDFLSLLDAQRMLLMAQLDYQMNIMNLITNQTDLERAIGIIK